MCAPAAATKVADKDKETLLQGCALASLRTLSQLEWLINKLMSRQ